MSETKVEISNQELHDLLKIVIGKSDEISEKVNGVQAEINAFKNDITAKVKLLEEENLGLQKENKTLAARLLTVDRKVRKYNIVIYGLAEQQTRTDDMTLVLGLIHEKLKLSGEYSDIRDCYRIGKESKERQRPLIVEFVSYQLKYDIIGNANKLKDTGIYLSNDYTPEDYQKRKLLYANLKEAKKQGLTGRIKGGTLIVDGESYTADKLAYPETTTGGHTQSNSGNSVSKQRSFKDNIVSTEESKKRKNISPQDKNRTLKLSKPYAQNI